MKIEADHFWNLLSESRILDASDLDGLRQKFYPPPTPDSDLLSAEKIARGLVGDKAITPLQAKVLLAGHAGPLVYGRYQLMSPGGADDIFLAIDRTTRYPLWLHFFRGTTSKDLRRWDRIERCCEKMQGLSWLNQVRVYEAVATPQYRFVVTGVPAGESLLSKLPGRSKLAVAKANWIALQAARAVEDLDRQKLGSPDDLLGALWLSKETKSGKSRQQVRLWASPIAMAQLPSVDNAGRLARLQWRLLTGRPAPDATDVSGKELAEELRSKVNDPISDSQVTAICDCLLGENDLRVLVSSLEKEVEDNESLPECNLSNNREQAYVQSLVPWGKNANDLPDAVPDLEPLAARDDADLPVAKSGTGISKSLALAISLFGFATLIGMGAFMATLKKVESRPILVADASSDTDAETVESVNEANAKRLKELETLRQSKSYVQEFVEDDQQTLWESPTAGFPASNRFMPMAPRMIAILDWEGIRKTASGEKAIRSLGPGLTESLAEMERLVAVPRSKWKSSTITWHTNDQFQYEWCVHVELIEPVPAEELLSGVEKSPGHDGVFESQSRFCWWITEGEQESVKSFLFGPSSRVKATQAGDIALLTGPLKRLVEQSDANRHVTFLSTTATLFNSEAQELMGERLRPLMREFRSRLPASVQGILVSFHFDQGDYLELRLDHSAAVKPNEMVSIARDRIGIDLVEMTNGFDQLTALGYWEPVRKRYAAMVREVARNMRWDAEFGNVIGNVWLRPGAIHNLFAATELAVSFPATSQQQVAAVAVPQTIEQLLDTRRNLSIANPPDLNVLLREIAEEVSDQYLDLPFEFVIRIAGSDLQKEGITQNQRPAAMNITDQSLAQILTQVMVAANPNRNISGPSDENCKLVWVIVEDEQNPGQKLVLVTTRSAALEKGYELPSSFVGQRQN